MRKNVLFEDVLNYNKWVSGIASRELASQRVTLSDLFNKTYADQHPNDAKADPILPFPLQNVIPQIGDLFIYACNAKSLFEDSLKNPVIQKNTAATAAVKQIVDKLTNIIDTIKSVINTANAPVAKKEK